MLIVAQALKGKEYLYVSETSHKISKNSSEIILKTLNEYKYKLKPGHIWHLYEIDEYDLKPYLAAQDQKFIKYKNHIKEVFTY